MVETLLTWGLVFLLAYAEGGFVIPFLLALGRLRVRSTGHRVRLTGLDPWPMAGAGFVLWLVPPLFPALGLGPAWVGIAAAVALWLGFRVEVRVTARGSLRVRRFAFVVPWGWRRYAEAPEAYVDGWGDFMDPEALHLAWRDGGGHLELAWGGAGSGDRCDELAAAFNAAVAALDG